ncbi:MAG: hypothetical protein ACREV6_15730 [Clostridium sp.]|uniref:hypothetical protein n=1 Tax=Clostridium sp. TaxID=1506 RepID=UPI003D6C9339
MIHITNEHFKIIKNKDCMVNHDTCKNVYYKHDLNKINEISENQYLKIKYGENHDKILKYFENAEPECITLLDGSQILSYYQESIIKRFDNKGDLIKIDKGNVLSNFEVLYSIEVDGNSIWGAFPTAHVIRKSCILTGEEEMSIGYCDYINDKSYPLCYPEHIIKYDNYLYISDMGSKRILRLDLNNYELDEYKKLNERVWAYGRIGKNEVVELESGMYIL